MRANHVAGIINRYQFCSRREKIVELRKIVIVGFGAEIKPFHGQSAVFRQAQPRRNIGVVIHAREHDLIACLKRRPNVRAMAKVSVVMFWPKTISRASLA